MAQKLGNESPGPFLEEHHLRLGTELASLVPRSLGSLPAAEDDRAARRQAREILELLGNAGVFRHAVPADYGGVAADIDLRACCMVREALAAVSPLADSVFALQCLGSMPLILAGSQEQKERWLPRVASGSAMAAFAMTELGAGSDVKALETRASRQDGGYVLDGTKAFISNAGLADFYTTFARIDQAAGETENGPIACFIVPAETPGLRFVGPQILSEPHPLGEIAFEACRVDESAVVGPPEEGLSLGFATLDRLRATVAAAACGMAARALAEAAGHARRRQQFGRPLSAFQLVQGKLATMATELEAARLLTYRAAWAADHGDEVGVRSAMAKLYATEAAQRVVDQAVQVLGGRGVLANSTVDRLYRSVRALRIYEGTSEIQQLVIARGLLAASSENG